MSGWYRLPLKLVSTSTNPRSVLHKPPFDAKSVRCITIFTSFLRLPCHESPFLHLTLLKLASTWSFANDRCLLDWTRADFEDYADFILNPTSAWVAPSKQTRFLGSAAMDFRDWPINPNWALFQGNGFLPQGASTSSREMDRHMVGAPSQDRQPSRVTVGVWQRL